MTMDDINKYTVKRLKRFLKEHRQNVSIDYYLVHCEHCKETSGIVEVKCPFKHRHLTSREAAHKSHLYCGVRNGNIKLGFNHIYYY
ncbi:hypothetical protein ACJMK2_032646 [Sinanodonta woodiana]|uniref:Uncharacterized protein n=1 Tax=Sinanodonta woodiana TaxID=1069815 RepID=A0ABD3X2D2_SINWO